jgi:hypothetical protein
LSYEKNNNHHIKHVKRSHVGKAQGGGGGDGDDDDGGGGGGGGGTGGGGTGGGGGSTGTGGKGIGKRSSANTINYMQRNIAKLSTKIDQLHLPDDDDEILEDEDGDGAHSHSNQALTHQTKKKGKMG